MKYSLFFSKLLERIYSILQRFLTIATSRRAIQGLMITAAAAWLLLLTVWLGSYRTLEPQDIQEKFFQFPQSVDPDPKTEKKMERKALRVLQNVRPRGTFVVIDRVHNRLWVRKGDHVIMEAEVSAGAGSILDDPSSDRSWVFDTPRGRFSIVNKRQNPLWTAPDWDYIERNEPLPRSHADRIQPGVLGEFALDLNIPNYMIHGTLYSRLLGRNVTHGCIRVGRDDLRVLWQRVPIGSPVFIF
ncbi:MAG TPA: L,D-transpeptidase [Thermoanaerobaculia bacterium]|nr:L,D-transpeptidase [Thermoanaerobaculia bacterium]HUM29480.1 L,D-transpeptidase [Thermoanaerobaculia bacterium]HXK67863.1 L,D-transpeptidase [Thermoanaerobaculia bacterium]